MLTSIPVLEKTGHISLNLCKQALARNAGEDSGNENELAALNDEADMPLEQLMALYGYVAGGAEAEHIQEPAAPEETAGRSPDLAVRYCPCIENQACNSRDPFGLLVFSSLCMDSAWANIWKRNGSGVRGRSQKQWAGYVREDLQFAELSFTWRRKSLDRAGWRAAIECLLQRT